MISIRSSKIVKILIKIIDNKRAYYYNYVKNDGTSALILKKYVKNDHR